MVKNIQICCFLVCSTCLGYAPLSSHSFVGCMAICCDNIKPRGVAALCPGLCSFCLCNLLNLPVEIFFLPQKFYFSREEIFFFTGGKKYFAGEVYITLPEKYILLCRRSISSLKKEYIFFEKDIRKAMRSPAWLKLFYNLRKVERKINYF